MTTTETKDGTRYTVDPAAFASILNDIEIAAQRIRLVNVKVQSVEPKATPDARGKAAAASIDGKFQNFMQLVIRPAAPK